MFFFFRGNRHNYLSLASVSSLPVEPNALARRQARRARRDPRGVTELVDEQQRQLQQQQTSALVPVGAVVVIGDLVAAPLLALPQSVSSLSAPSPALFSSLPSAAARSLLCLPQGGGQVVGRDRR
jgi:hypothetical protein